MLFSFTPRCTCTSWYIGYLLLKPPHPSLPLTGQSHALRLEYFLKNNFTAATVKSTLKNQTQPHVLSAFDMLRRMLFSVTFIHQQKEIKVCRKKCIFVSIGIISGLSPLFFFSLCCFARLTTGNKFYKQEARSEDPSGVHIVGSAAWASPHKLDVEVGISF